MKEIWVTIFLYSVVSCWITLYNSSVNRFTHNEPKRKTRDKRCLVTFSLGEVIQWLQTMDEPYRHLCKDIICLFDYLLILPLKKIPRFSNPFGLYPVTPLTHLHLWLNDDSCFLPTFLQCLKYFIYFVISSIFSDKFLKTLAKRFERSKLAHTKKKIITFSSTVDEITVSFFQFCLLLSQAVFLHRLTCNWTLVGLKCGDPSSVSRLLKSTL